MKRSCNGCRAFNTNNYCDLGYKIEKVYSQYIVINGKPLEECPKPKTYDKYIELYRRGNK